MVSLNLNNEINQSTNIELVATANEDVALEYSYTQPKHGSLTGTAPNLTYTPSFDYVGQDSFSYQAEFNGTVSETVQVTIHVINTENALDSIFVETSDIRSRDINEELKEIYGDDITGLPGDYFHWQENAENYIEVGYRTGKAVHEAGYLIKNDNSNTLKVFLMAGQSNMEGKGRCYESEGYRVKDDGTPHYENIGKNTLEYLLDNDDYLDDLKTKTNNGTITGSEGDALYHFFDELDATYLEPRDNVWVTTLDSSSGAYIKKDKVIDGAVQGESMQLQPGLNHSTNGCGYGIELAMGHYLADRYDSPILLYKAAKGGMSLHGGFRPPSAVTKRGGEIGANFSNMETAFTEFMQNLNPVDYGANEVEISGFVWLQGWNDRGNGKDRYLFNVLDLVSDVRDFIGQSDLPAIMIASPHQTGARDLDITDAKIEAVEILNGEINQSPVIIQLDQVSGTASVDQAIAFSTSATDVDEDELMYTWALTITPEELDDDQLATIEILINDDDPSKATLTTAFAGDYQLGVWVSDGKDQLRKTIDVTVTEAP